MSAVAASVLAVVWHYWIGVAVTIMAVLAVVLTIVGWLVKVGSARYPRQ
jgi:hypothetical protein